MSKKVWIATFQDRMSRVTHTIGVYDTKELAIAVLKDRAHKQCDYLKAKTGDNSLKVCDLGAQGIVDYCVNVTEFLERFGDWPVTFYEVREETIQTKES